MIIVKYCEMSGYLLMQVIGRRPSEYHEYRRMELQTPARLVERTPPEKDAQEDRDVAEIDMSIILEERGRR